MRASHKKSTAYDKIRDSFLPKETSLYEEKYGYVGEVLIELIDSAPRFYATFTQSAQNYG
jgi:hypothetical protein